MSMKHVHVNQCAFTTWENLFYSSSELSPTTVYTNNETTVSSMAAQGPSKCK